MKQLSTLMAEIVQKKPPLFSVWVGTEPAIMRIYQQQIELLGYEETLVESVAEALHSSTKKAITGKKKCYVINHDSSYLKAEKVWESVTQRLQASGNIAILKYTDIDKRSRFYKVHEQYLTRFDKLEGEVLQKYTAKELPQLTEMSVNRLIRVCSSDYGRILLEADKIKQYGGEQNATLETLLEDRTIRQDFELETLFFDFVDAVVTGDVGTTPKLLETINSLGESPLGVITLLYMNFRDMLMIQGIGEDRSNIEAKTGIPYWKAKKTIDKMGGYTVKELQRALEVLRKCEYGIKMGLIPQEVALDYAVLNIMK